MLSYFKGEINFTNHDYVSTYKQKMFLLKYFLYYNCLNDFLHQSINKHVQPDFGLTAFSTEFHEHLHFFKTFKYCDLFGLSKKDTNMATNIL